MIATEASLIRLIQLAQDTGADADYVQNLKDDLARLKSKGLRKPASNITHSYKRIEPDGTYTVRISTTSIDPEHDDVFEGVSLKSVKKG
jgi:hypothetical protein